MSKRNGILPKLLIFMSLLVLWGSPAWANNLKISNVSLEDRNPTNNTVVIEFDISWDNSWKDSINHDAAWVFLKACNSWNGTKCTAAYKHGVLDTAGTNPTGTSYGSNGNVEVYIPNDRKGAFIRRNATGSGTLSSTNVRLVMDYGESGIADTDSIVVKVFGIEMVYISEGPFYIGDGNGTNESANACHVTDNTKQQITTALTGSIKVDSNAQDDSQLISPGIGIDGDGGLDTDNNGTVDNVDFPTGYRPFYLMKYELTQAQYRDFLNTLSRAQQKNRTTTNVSTDAITNVYVMSNYATVTGRNGIRAPASGNGTTDPIIFGCSLDGNATFNEFDDGENVAMNYLIWPSLLAYADWAGLRPYTESEFEKAARGPSIPLYQEYAWGSTTITQVSATIQNSGLNNEVPSNKGKGLSNYNMVDVPLRAGFAAASSTDRESAGSGYYGNMEMSGNLWEMIASLGESTGRGFRGSNGDGILTTTSTYEGNATNTDWPGKDATLVNGVTGGTGDGLRGGSLSRPSTESRLSDRFRGAFSAATLGSEFGGRLARTGYKPVTGFSVGQGDAGTQYYYSVIVTKDFGYIAAGYSTIGGTYEGLIVRYDEQGNVLWAKSLGDTAADYFYDAFEMSDGSIVAVGTTKSYSATVDDAFIAKFDAAGTEQWTKTVGGGTGNSDYFFDVVGLSDGSIVAGGKTKSYSGTNDKYFLVKFDSTGDANCGSCWAKTLAPGGTLDTLSGLTLMRDGGFIATGQVYVSNDWEAGISKFNSSGVEQWTRYIGLASTDAFTTDVLEMDDGSIIAAGQTGDILIVKFSSDGQTMLWAKTFDAASATQNVNGLAKTSDGGFVVVGLHAGTDAFVAKFNSGGEVQWGRNFGAGGLADEYLEVDGTDDGGVVLVGYTKDYGGSDWDALLVRLDKNGNPTGDTNFICGAITSLSFSSVANSATNNSLSITETNQSVSETDQVETQGNETVTVFSACP